MFQPAGGHLLPAVGGVGVAFLLGYFGQVETAGGVDGGVDLGAVVRRLTFGCFSLAAVSSSDESMAGLVLNIDGVKGNREEPTKGATSCVSTRSNPPRLRMPAA